MTRLSEEEINQTRDYFFSQGFPLRQVRVGGKDLSFFVLDANLNPNLKNFAFVCVGNRHEDRVVGVSEDVPKEFQKYWAFHEETEYVDIGEEVKGRCLLALDKELAIVPEKIKPVYIPLRTQFFRDLVGYAEARPNNYSREQVAEFVASRDKLNSIICA